MKKALVNLGLKAMSVPEIIAFSFVVASRMIDNVFFREPSPALKQVTDAAMALQRAFEAATGGDRAQTEIMDNKRRELELLLTALAHYVEDTANAPANASVASPEAIILSAGMSVRRFTPRQRRIFAARHGTLSGTVLLVAKRVNGGSHEWQYSLIPDGEWIEAAPTTRAAKTLTGLEPGKRYYFRHRAVTPLGPSDWEGPIDLVVL